MQKVLVDLHRLGGNPYNGLYHFCYHLGHGLANLSSRDLELYFYLPQSKVGLFGSGVNSAIQRSRDKIYRPGTGRYGVWHVATTLSWYRPFSTRTRNLYTIHDLNFLKEEEYSASSKKKYLKLIKQRVNRADQLSFISEFARRQAMEHLDLGRTPGTVIYNGRNIPPPGPYEAPAYRPAKPFLFTIGQLHARKNFHVLPALLARQDMELVIAGLKDFPYAEKVMDQAHKWGVEDRVKLVGPVTEQEKCWYYQHSEAFLFPSVGEGFGLPVLEAMHFEKPIFLAASTSLPEVGGPAAYYFHDFDPGTMQDVFEKGMHDFCTRDCRPAIRAQLERFDWRQAALGYMQLYRQLL